MTDEELMEHLAEHDDDEVIGMRRKQGSMLMFSRSHMKAHRFSDSNFLPDRLAEGMLVVFMAFTDAGGKRWYPK